IKSPDAHKALVKALAADRIELLLKSLTPASECFGVILAKAHCSNHGQAGSLGFTLEGRDTGQQPSGKNELLDKVGGVQITGKKVFAQGDGLHAGIAARF